MEEKHVKEKEEEVTGYDLQLLKFLTVVGDCRLVQ